MKTRIFAILCAAFFSLLSILGILLMDGGREHEMQLLKLFEEEIQKPTSTADSLLDKAREFIDTAKFDSAEVLLAEAWDRYKERDDKRGLVQSKYEKARMLERKREYKNALEVLDKNIEDSIHWFGGEDLDHANNLHLQGLLLRRIGEFDNGREKYIEALRIRQSIPNTPALDIGRSLNNIGVTYAERGLYQKGLGYYEKALAIREENLGANHRDVAQSYNNIGNLYKNTRDFGKSLAYHNQALKIRKELFGLIHPEIGASYYNIGNVFSLTGRNTEGLRFHKKALDIWSEIFDEQHPYIHLTLQAIGLDYEGLGYLDKAIEYTKHALVLQKRYSPNNTVSTGDSYLNLGVLSSKLGAYNAAENYYSKSLQEYLVRWEGRHPFIAKSYNGLAEVELNKSNFENAKYYVEKAIESNRRDSTWIENKIVTSYYDVRVLWKSKAILASIFNEMALIETGNLKIELLRKSLGGIFRSCG